MPRNVKDIEDEELVDELADRMDLNDEERQAFKRICMTKAGYRIEPRYERVESKDDRDDGFF
jgi:hypothetical protein